MYDTKCGDFMITPNTVLTRWQLKDFNKVLEFNDLNSFLEDFWDSVAGFSVEFNVICKALDCLENDEDFFTYYIYDNEAASFNLLNVSAAAIVCKERLLPLATTVSSVLNTCKVSGRDSDVLKYLRENEEFSRALNYMKNLFAVTLSDGSYLDRDRVEKVRGKLRMYDKMHGTSPEATFFVADRSVLYDALDALEKKCIF